MSSPFINEIGWIYISMQPYKCQDYIGGCFVWGVTK